jgi:hypothetical protein
MEDLIIQKHATTSVKNVKGKVIVMEQIATPSSLGNILSWAESKHSWSS